MYIVLVCYYFVSDSVLSLIHVRGRRFINKEKIFHIHLVTFVFTLSFSQGVQPKEKAKVAPSSQPTFTGMC